MELPLTVTVVLCPAARLIVPESTIVPLASVTVYGYVEGILPPVLDKTKVAVPVLTPLQEPTMAMAGGLTVAVLVGVKVGVAVTVCVGVAVGRRKQEPLTVRVTDDRKEVR